MTNSEITEDISNEEDSQIYDKSLLDNWRIYFNRFTRNYASMIGLFIFCIFLMCVIVSFVDNILFEIAGYGLFSHRPNALFEGRSNEPISPTFWFGTDHIGRDVFVRVVYGAGLTLITSIFAGLLGITLGTFFGLLSGYFGGQIDTIITMITEIFLAIPGILLALAIVAVTGTSLENIMIAVGLSSSPYYVRVIRSETMVQRELTYVKAAKVLGAKPPNVVFKHILPNIFSLIIIYGTLGMGTAILSITGLSFLGLGPQMGTLEWGKMVADAKDSFYSAPHSMFFPGLAILLAALSFNLIGDGLQEALNPSLED